MHRTVGGEARGMLLALVMASTLLASGCDLGCLTCPSDKPYLGAQPAQGPAVHAEISRLQLWDTLCYTARCAGRPEVAPEGGSYALRLAEGFYLEIEVVHPGIAYRVLSITMSQSWGRLGDLGSTTEEREDHGLLFTKTRFLQAWGRLPPVPGAFSILIRVEERGPDLPTPVIIERQLLIRPLPVEL